MGAALTEFLEAADLDDLLDARENLAKLTDSEQEEILAIVRRWDPPQSIANLLMYPEVIPPYRRVRASLDGLYERVLPYHILAAIVGLPRVAPGELPDKERATIIGRLVELIEVAQGPLADRASITLDGLISRSDADQIVGLLNQDAAVVKHNILSTLINVVGLDQIRPYLEQAKQEGAISQEALEYSFARFATIVELAEGDEATELFALSDLSASQLTYIPALQDVMTQ